MWCVCRRELAVADGCTPCEQSPFGAMAVKDIDIVLLGKASHLRNRFYISGVRASFNGKPEHADLQVTAKFFKSGFSLRV